MNITQNLGEYLATLHRHSRTRKPTTKDPAWLELEESNFKIRQVQNKARGVFSLVLYPNGEFGLGRLKRDEKSAEDKRQERNVIYESQWNREPRPVELEDGRILYDASDKILLPTKLGTSQELSQPPKKYGQKGITGYGRRMVRNCAYVMEQIKEYKDKLQMGTLTIPSLPEEQMLIICSNWAYLVKRFFEKCKRRHEQHNINFSYVSVTEIQPKRWESRREVGLHIHFLFVSRWIPENSEWALPDSWVRQAWLGSLCSLLGTSDGIPTPNYRRESIRISAAGYMAKYLSKGVSQTSEIIAEMGAEWLPSQWWSASLHLRRMVKSAIIKCRHENAEILLDICEGNWEGWLHYVSDICVDIPAFEYKGERRDKLRIGWRGKLTQFAMEYLGFYLPSLYWELTLDKILDN